MGHDGAVPFQVIKGRGELTPVFEGYSVPEGVVEGQPVERIYYHLENEKLAVNAGYWEAEPGVIRYEGFPWNEFCMILEGELQVAEDGKPPLTLRAGDAFFITKDFRGTWTLPVPVRKYFVEALAEDESPS